MADLLLNARHNYKNMTKKIFFLVALSIFLLPTSLVLAGTNTPTNAPFITQINNPIGTTSTIELINRVSNYLLWMAVILGPMVIVGAALIFLTSGGNDRKITTAKKMLLYAVLGLALALISKGIVSLVRDFLST
jgi:4-amino-4-deoxy-L-arabinose transferase-like glycosyltransferase